MGGISKIRNALGIGTAAVKRQEMADARLEEAVAAKAKLAETRDSLELLMRCGGWPVLHGLLKARYDRNVSAMLHGKPDNMLEAKYRAAEVDEIFKEIDAILRRGDEPVS